MKNRKNKMIGMLLAGIGILFSANAIVAGPRAFWCGTAGVIGLILSGSLLTICGVVMFLRNNTE